MNGQRVITSYFCTRKQATIAHVYDCTPLIPIGSDVLIEQKPYRVVGMAQHIDSRSTVTICQTYVEIEPLFPE